jgi:signal peptidase I
MATATDIEVLAGPGWLRQVVVGRDPRRTLARVVLLVVVCFILFYFILLPVRVQGISMLPTYQDHSINLINRLAYLFHEPQRGDVVAIKIAGPHIVHPHNMYLKRIVGLPGETIEFRDGQLLINGQPIDEPYVVLRSNWNHEPEQIGSGEYYVVGDNRSMDFYGHEQGRAYRWQIVGKPLR